MFLLFIGENMLFARLPPRPFWLRGRCLKNPRELPTLPASATFSGWAWLPHCNAPVLQNVALRWGEEVCTNWPG